MKTIVLTLTAQNMGDLATEADFDSFTALVDRRIGDLTGLDVSVETFAFVGGPGRDRVSGGEDGDEEKVREALRTCWEEWCTSTACTDARDL